MDKAPAYGAGDSRFESWRGRIPSHSVVVSTRDFESRDPGSSPGGRVSLAADSPATTFLVDSRVNKKTFPTG